MAHSGWKWSDEAKARVRGRPSPLKGIKRTPEDIAKMRAGNREKRKPMIYTHTCDACKKSFQSRFKKSKYCSQKCYHESKTYHLICERCGRLFSSKAKNALFCQNCLMRQCEFCGLLFYVKNGGVKYRYCSHECYHLATRGKEPHNKQPGVDLICSVCGKTFNVWKSRLSRGVKYCSYECKYEAQSQVTGESHPLWKGGYDLYGRKLSENKGSFYRNRRLVLERDNHTCMHCGFKGPSNIMDVHHIIPVREVGPNIPSNMITLCRKCHNHADRNMISRNTLIAYIDFEMRLASND